MGMIADMLFAIAIIAVAPGAVAEFQLRIGDVRSAADSTLVVIGCFDGSNAGLIRPGGGEGNGLGSGGWRILFLLPEQPGCVDPPGHGENIDNILAEEQEIVEKGNKGEQTVGEEARCSQLDHVQHHQRKIQHCKDPCLDRDDEQEQKLGVGVQRCVTQKQTQIQIADSSPSAENHAENILQKDTGQIKQIKPQRTPEIFHGPPQRKVAEQTDSGQQNAACVVGKSIGEKPPDLALQDQLPVKAEGVIKGVAGIKHTDQIYQGAAEGHIQHQIGDSFCAVAEAEALKAAA